jgi:hypothetical protein
MNHNSSPHETEIAMESNGIGYRVEKLHNRIFSVPRVKKEIVWKIWKTHPLNILCRKPNIYI